MPPKPVRTKPPVQLGKARCVERMDARENTEREPEPEPEPEPTTTPQSKKRRISDEKDKRDGDDAASEVLSVNQDECFSIEYDCDEVRDKIREYLENSKMKATDFQKKLHVTPAVYRAFMNQSQGMGNGLKNKPMRLLTSSSHNTNLAPRSDLPTLPGEGDGSTPVYDTCNDVRTKIDAHLKKYNLTKKAFAEQISKCQAMGDTEVTPTQVTAFQRKSGPLAGNSTKAFYASYVFFEKLRIKEGKDKSKKREEMEEVHGDKGVMTHRAIESMHFTQPQGSRVFIDKYGHPRNSRGTW